MNLVTLITALRVSAAAAAGILSVTLFLQGPIGSLVLDVVPYWGPGWVRLFLFILVVGLAAIASLYERRRTLMTFVAVSLLLTVPSVYPFSSIDWVGLLTGSGPVDFAPPSQVIVSIELVLATLCFLAVFYLGWLRSVVLDSTKQGMEDTDLNAIAKLSLRFLAGILGIAGGFGIVTSLAGGIVTSSLTNFVEKLPMAIPILGLCATFVLAAAMFLGLIQRPQTR